MTDHFARPYRAASSERVAELHRLCDADYAKGQQERATALATPSYSAFATAAAVTPAPEPTDLDVAISVAQQLLDSGDATILRESPRILLRALGAEPLTEDEAVRRSVDAQFPTIAAFLADEQEAGQ